MRRVITLLLLFVLGCQIKSTPEDQGNVHDRPISEIFSDIEEFHKLEEFIEWNHILNDVVKKTGFTESEVSTFVSSFKEGFSSKLVGKKFQESGTLLFNRVPDENASVITLEISNGKDFDFFEIEIDTINNQIKNVFVYSIGETISDVISSQLLLSSRNRAEQVVWYDLAKESLDEGSYEESWDYIYLVPDELRYEFPFRTVVQNLAELELDLAKEYITTLSEFGFNRKHLGYLSLKSGLLHDEQILTFQGINMLSEDIENSLLLNTYRGYSYELAGETEKAIDEYDFVIDSNPKSLMGYLSKIELFLSKGDSISAFQVIRDCNKEIDLTDEDWTELLTDEESSPSHLLIEADES